MEYSKTGLQLTESFESCRLSAYQDSGGKWTIGWGTTYYPNGKPVQCGDTITQLQADSYIIQKYDDISYFLNRLLLVPVTQQEFDALCDFIYNVGTENFAHSSLLRYINSSNFTEAANEFDKWDHVNGSVVAGLLRRRQAETQEFNS